MKEIVSEIKDWIIVIYMTLRLLFKMFKNIALYKMKKINTHFCKSNIIDALYEYYHGIIIHDIDVDVDEVIEAYNYAVDKILKC